MLESLVELTVALDQDSRMEPSFSSKILGSRMGRSLLLFGVKKFSGLWEEKMRRNALCLSPQGHLPHSGLLLLMAQDALHVWPAYRLPPALLLPGP